MADTLRIGIIGAGANTRLRHIPGFQAIEGVKVTTVCNRTEGSSQKAADEFGIPRIAARWQDVVEDPEIDAICIGTWPYLHAPITIAALQAGKHVLTEARMARDLAEAQQMMTAAEAHPDLVAQIVPVPFTLNYDATIRQMLKEGKLGELREVNLVQTMSALADAGAPLTWRQDFELSGKNVLMMGIFHEAVQHWLEEDPVWVQADATIHTTERTHWETGEIVEVKIPDAISITGRFASGARLDYTFSGVESGLPRNEARLHGSKGSLRIHLMQDELHYAKAGSSEETAVEIPVQHQRGWRVEEDFVDSIRTGAPVRYTSFAQGLRYMAFTDAVYRSYTNEGRREYC